MEDKKTTIEIPFGMFQEFLEYNARVKAVKALIAADGEKYSRDAVAEIVGVRIKKNTGNDEEEIF